jgi:hypothetical protein
MKPIIWTLILEAIPVGKTLAVSRMIVKANTKEDAVEGLKKIFSGEIKGQDIPKTGLDLTNKPINGLSKAKQIEQDALDKIHLTQELNRNLKKIGVSIDFKKKK